MTYNRIVIIGARGNSSRILNKNLRSIDCIPLIVFTLKVAEELGYPVYVSSDSDKILDTVEFYSGAHTIKRPDELASETAIDKDWIRHLLTTYYEEHNSFPMEMIYLRPTTPFRNAGVLRNAIEKFDNVKYTSLRSVEEMRESAFKTFTIDNGYLKGFSDKDKDMPNQLVTPTYSGNGYVDILVTKQLLEFDTLYGNSIQPFLTPKSVEIDTEDDLAYANYYYHNRIKK